MMKIGNGCHRDYSAIMANAGFGPLTIFRGTTKIMIPRNGVRKSDGTPKLSWRRRISDLTLSNCVWLGQRGAEITTA